MSERAARSKLLPSALCLLLACSGAARTQTQETPAETPPRLRREFGSSLERLKWDAEQKRAFEVAPARARGEAGGDEEDEVVRVETSLVVCDVLVLNAKGDAVVGLKREDFIVTEDGKPQEVGMFSLGDGANVPRSIVLVIDYSGSMRPFIENSVEAAKTLVDKLAPRDRMAIVTDDVELLADFTRDKALLKQKLDGLRQQMAPSTEFEHGRYGRSRQYSALMATLRELFGEEDMRPVVIFQTDGDELEALRNSPAPSYEPPAPPGVSPEQLQALRARREAARPQFGLADVLRQAERSRATVYTVIPGVQLIGVKPGEEREKQKALRDALGWRAYRPSRALSDALERTAGMMQLEQTALYGLSKLTGGWTSFLEKPSQAAGIYANIFADVNQRYVVGFYPANRERDGKRRRVQIEVRDHPEYTVWGRKSYYAPEPQVK